MINIDPNKDFVGVDCKLPEEYYLVTLLTKDKKTGNLKVNPGWKQWSSWGGRKIDLNEVEVIAWKTRRVEDD